MSGYSIDQINFSDINADGTFSPSKQIILKNKSVSYKYMLNNNDVLLPSTIQTSAKAKVLNPNGGILLYKGVYSSNIVVLRLEEENQIYSPSELCTILNTEPIQQQLLQEVYSKGKIKAISMEKLRHFKIPVIEEGTLKQELKAYTDYKIKMQNQEKKINILMKDILSK